MDFEWHVGDVVRKLRLKRGLSQKELAAAAKPPLHHNTIVRLEDGHEGIQGRTLSRVAAALGVTPKDLWALVPARQMDIHEEPQRALPPASTPTDRPPPATGRLPRADRSPSSN